MGFAVHWAAIKGSSLQNMCEVFGVRRTGFFEEFPESDVTGAELPSGWSLIFFHRTTIDEDLLSRLSEIGDVVACFVEDHVMYSEAAGWRKGGQIWSVVHDCNKGLAHLEARGLVPEPLAEIKRRLTEEQNAHGGEKANVDFLHDGPAQLCQTLVGFRHDQDVEGANGSIFEVLEQNGSASRPGLVGALKNLFGKTNRK